MDNNRDCSWWFNHDNNFDNEENRFNDPIDITDSPAESDVTVEYDPEAPPCKINANELPSSSDIIILDDDDPPANKILQPNKVHKTAYFSSNKEEKFKRSIKESDGLPTKKTKNLESKEEKERKKLEKARAREEKRIEKEREKNVKASLVAKQRSIKPEEAIKHITALIDTGVINMQYGSHILSTLDKEGIKKRVDSFKSNVISWTKTGPDATDLEIPHDGILKLLLWSEFVKLVSNDELLHNVKNWKASKETKITLIILGMEKYWNFQTIQTNRTLKAAVTGSQIPRGNKKEEAEYAAAPRLTREDVEHQLAQVQLLTNTTHRNIENAEDLATLVFQWTKSISQIEAKRTLYAKEKDSLSWFARADSKNCVKVDKNGNGLKEVWQQQICQFYNIGLEVAQAIVCEYGSPQQLLKAYGRCHDPAEAADILANIPVRRDAGVLSSARRVGPELSHKIHRFLTSADPNLPV